VLLAARPQMRGPMQTELRPARIVYVLYEFLWPVAAVSVPARFDGVMDENIPFPVADLPMEGLLDPVKTAPRLVQGRGSVWFDRRE